MAIFTYDASLGFGLALPHFIEGSFVLCYSAESSVPQDRRCGGGGNAGSFKHSG